MNIKQPRRVRRRKRKHKEGQLQKGDRLYLNQQELDLLEYKYVIGLDEAGWGAVAGPLSVACSVLPIGSTLTVKDSKAYSSADARSKALENIRQEALHLQVMLMSASDLTKNKPGPGREQMMLDLIVSALSAFKPEECIVVLDGAYIPKRIKTADLKCRVITIPKADTKIKAVSAASVLAKVERDAYMVAVASSYPEYDFAKNKGYLTAEHKAMIKQHGLSFEHRSYIKGLL